MAQWKNENQAEDSVIWGPALVKQAVNETNRDELFENETPDAFIEGVTAGQYGFDTDAMDDAGSPAHAGWVLTKTGSGGRAGRVQHEVLVAMSSIEPRGVEETPDPAE